jgi:RNA polymerase sigma factor (sigma-70 family)
MVPIMSDRPDDTARLVARLRAGDSKATGLLLAQTCNRLRACTHQMLKGFACVRRFEDTDDVLQQALIKLCKALAKRRPENTTHFYNLASMQIRRRLIELARRHRGPLGIGANHHSDPCGGLIQAVADPVGEPTNLDWWVAFHKAAKKLPKELRVVFHLIYYQGLTQEAAALELGKPIRTVRRRWQEARLKIAELLGVAGPTD